MVLEDFRQKVLCLGMVFAEEQHPKRGQEFRDRVRCEALEKIGYKTFTLDDKHNGDRLGHGRHCTANFADSRRMLKMMQNRWGEDNDFDYIVLDYFFSPEGWARTRWTEAFFKQTIPMLTVADVLKPNGAIYLPNLECVEELLLEFDTVISEHYSWKKCTRPKDNPLYRATEKANEELLRCPDKLTNTTQMQPLYNFSDTPFIVLKRLNRSYKKYKNGELIRKGGCKHPPIIPSKFQATPFFQSSLGNRDNTNHASLFVDLDTSANATTATTVTTISTNTTTGSKKRKVSELENLASYLSA